MPDISNSYFAAVIKGAQEVCRQSTLVGFHEKLPSLSELFIRFANGEEAPVALPETPRFPFQKL